MASALSHHLQPLLPIADIIVARSVICVIATPILTAAGSNYVKRDE